MKRLREREWGCPRSSEDGNGDSERGVQLWNGQFLPVYLYIEEKRTSNAILSVKLHFKEQEYYRRLLLLDYSEN